MSYQFYQIIHYSGIIVLFFGLGALFGAGRSLKPAAIAHGVGLLLVLVGGFGLQAKLMPGQFPGWMISKIAIWIVLGATLVLLKRKVLPPIGAALLAVGLGVVATLLAVLKPF